MSLSLYHAIHMGYGTTYVMPEVTYIWGATLSTVGGGGAIERSRTVLNTIATWCKLRRHYDYNAHNKRFLPVADLPPARVQSWMQPGHTY